jgi:DNA-binding transcriptional MocR family regulator
MASPKYERVADRLSRLIACGTLRPGERMPSVRRLARQETVSVSTVLEAYTVLEDRGLVETRPQSGHYVRQRRLELLEEPRPPRPAAGTTRVSLPALVGEVYGAVRDPDVVPLGAATPSMDLLPHEKLTAMLREAARAHPSRVFGYDAPPGSIALRRQIARRALEWGGALGPDDLVTTVGCMEALHLSLRAVTRAGDTVAVESPTYYGLLQLIESLELRAVEVPVDARTGMDLVALEELVERHRIKAVLAIPSFSNPMGSLMPEDAREKLVGMLGRREIPLIEDDIYGELSLDEHAPRPRPCQVFDKRGLVMLCGSFSKTLAPGFRVGWVAPGRFRDQIERLKFAHTVATPSLQQLAIASFLEGGGYDRHLRRMRRTLAGQVSRVREAVATHFPPGTRVSRPQGGFVLWVELPRGQSALELHARALERGISIAPGPIFSARGRFPSCIRLNCGHPYDELIDRSIRTLGRLAAA